ncbi:hypothetical protein HBI56_190390 [Parastagonospora nodorum]|uniref:J domain-containing protein n=2 Tax=Phaeosphaeria nodorum (strain SN15 / ATCC MYA-4574 / FGSC 10173) TaxID=321614 RepID=A0A7U2FED4_PHANO|nr:hypothetical protein HBH56_144060 [Parastagonospora nodorum]QRD01435.1 hypothetical protein JI435_120960 [Parastagonospora nodorum SN15]KAH3927736.1 hypothetical protein HBH54_149250 [Parastagonospora nodorum]KAH3962082.1 hypothetical protein HBH51_177900 [Parastagonospora nodorum]KAH3970817.1 hypothetical protein HBH52_162250 [Parastagonospora nodorum]
MDDRDYYADLGLTLYASMSQIKAAFHALAKQHHPDKSGSSDTTAFRCIREAFEKLSDVEFKMEYDRNFRGKRMHFDSNVGYGPTRTAAYEAEVASEAKSAKQSADEAYDEMVRRSPPPKPPARKFNESGRSYFFSRAYTAWAKRDTVYRQKHPTYDEAHSNASATVSSSGTKAHGLTVQMSSHPAAGQRCTLRTSDWRQTVGSDSCVFCLKPVTNGNRCPGCQVLACPTCSFQIAAAERSSAFRGFSSTKYFAAGG